MIKFSDLTRCQRMRFTLAWCRCTPPVYDARMGVWPFPWFYAPMWMVDAATVEDAALIWWRLWRADIINGRKPEEMEVFYA